ncbi:MAG: hypothetical protein Q9183_008045, partial [Haloplaca sp. 2 TL-2023]
MSSIPADQLDKDGIYPNDEAYKLMADRWLEGIKKAIDDGWVKGPVDPAPELLGAVDQDPLQKRSDLLPRQDNHDTSSVDGT